MDIKNRQVGVAERPGKKAGGEIVLFERSTFSEGLGVLQPFGTASAVENFLTLPVAEAPAVALQIIDKKDPRVVPEVIDEIETIRRTAQAEDAVKLADVRSQIQDIQKGLKP